MEPNLTTTPALHIYPLLEKRTYQFDFRGEFQRIESTKTS